MNSFLHLIKNHSSMILLCLILCSACNFPGINLQDNKQLEGQILNNKTTPPLGPSPLSSWSTEKNCIAVVPEGAPPENPYRTIIEPFDLVVSSGNRIYGLIRRPDPEQYTESCFPAVILVPGGINPGRMEAHGQEARALSEAGMVVITFNAEGRVNTSPDDILSEGSEDFNGFRHQDSLCDLVNYTIQLPYVISTNVGIKTQSFGITMGAGCAGRYPDIPIKYIVDGEGPPNSFVTCHEPYAMDDDPSNDKHEIVFGILGHYSTYRDPSPENIAFWEEREADRFIGNFRGLYLRLQAEWDHSQPPENMAQVLSFTLPPLWWQNKHTMDIVNIAIDGGVPWVRINLPEQNNQVNAKYTIENPPTYLPGMLADKPWSVRAILEMAGME